MINRKTCLLNGISWAESLGLEYFRLKFESDKSAFLKESSPLRISYETVPRKKATNASSRQANAPSRSGRSRGTMLCSSTTSAKSSNEHLEENLKSRIPSTFAGIWTFAKTINECLAAFRVTDEQRLKRTHEFFLLRS